MVVAAGAGLLWPSEELAARADVILAALVLAVTLTIPPGRLWAARRHWPRVLVLVLLPLLTLLPVAVGLGRLFTGEEREGLLALGLAPTEVAAVGLVAIAAGDAALALLVCVSSLAVTAIAAPLLAPLLSDADLDPGRLLVRFGLVVLVPLAAGLLARAGGRFEGAGRFADPAATVILAALVYAALGDLGSLSELGPAALASLAFLAASIMVALLVRPLVGEFRTSGFVFSFRDFAVAAALAIQLVTPGAATTTAVYGVLMLLAAAAGANLLRRRRPHEFDQACSLEVSVSARRRSPG